MKSARLTLAVFLALWADAAVAAIFIYVPVVTQVQGIAKYRTSLAVSNVGPSAQTVFTFSYRSPVDGSMQNAVFLDLLIGTNDAFATDDFVDYMKAKGAIRAEDRTVALFGTLEVQMLGNVDARDVSVVARTYSLTPDGGTVGLSYVGRVYNATNEALNRVVTTIRNGPFGQDGNSRANIGFASIGSTPMDLRIVYIDATTHLTLKSFDLSAAVGHLLAPREVVQLNNIFADPALTGASRVIVTATSSFAQTFTGYAVQLDNTTNDGSFFLMTEK